MRVRNTPRCLYRLPELLASPQVETVFIVEGGKHVDRLRLQGAAVTQHMDRAGAWMSHDIPRATKKGTEVGGSDQTKGFDISNLGWR